MSSDRKRDLPRLYDSYPGPAEEDRTSPGGRVKPIPANVDRSLARLVVLVGDRAGRRFILSSEVLIGRSEDAAIQLEDFRVSRQHALLRPLPDGGFEIEDYGSSNGTLVNGKRIERISLRFGDRIQIGEYVLLYTHHDPLADQILMRQRLEAIGRMGAGIAHDFNNLLGVVVASLDFLDALPGHRRPNDSEVNACLDDIRKATTRATELTGRLLVYSRQDRAEYTAVNVSLLCREVIELLRRTFDQSIEIEIEIEPDLVVDGHAGELHQVLMNLCLNARDAMPDGGKVVVAAKVADGKPELSLRNSRYVVLKVSDTGSPLPAAPVLRFSPTDALAAGASGAGSGVGFDSGSGSGAFCLGAMVTT